MISRTVLAPIDMLSYSNPWWDCTYLENSFNFFRAVARILHWRGSAPASAVSIIAQVCASTPIELRQGSGGAAPGKFLGNFTS